MHWEYASAARRSGAMFKLSIRGVPAVAAMLLLLLRPSVADACACCGDPGLRIEASEKMTSYERGEIGRFNLENKAKTYSNAGWPDGVKGIADPQTEYAVTYSVMKDVVTFTFKDQGKTGALSFAMPKTLEVFAVDRKPGASGGDPTLYKEWRLTSAVTPTGIFASANSKTPPIARLIFHGEGNACTDATQFTHWTLVVKGPNADFTFFGSLTKPKASP
jgi:hypothetical protein